MQRTLVVPKLLWTPSEVVAPDWGATIFSVVGRWYCRPMGL